MCLKWISENGDKIEIVLINRKYLLSGDSLKRVHSNMEIRKNKFL